MKHKFVKIISIVILVLMVSTLYACSANQDLINDSANLEQGAPPQNAEDGGGGGGETTPDRKIIYSADVSLNVVEYDAQIAKIRAAMNADEWFDSETVSSTYAYFVARVKTDHLDAFLDEITADISADAMSMQKYATDISLAYQSKDDQILSLNEEKTLLNQYLTDETISAAYAITRLTEINTEIRRLNGELSSYDSLIEYSTVTIRLNRTAAPTTPPGYGERASGTLSAAWEALGKFFQSLGLAAIAIFPWLLVIVPVSAIVVLAIRFKKRLKPFHKIARKVKKGSSGPAQSPSTLKTEIAPPKEEAKD
jgi:hypothetical protein